LRAKDTACADDQHSISDEREILKEEVELLEPNRKKIVIRHFTLVRNILIDSMPHKLFCPLPNQSLNDWYMMAGHILHQQFPPLECHHVTT